MQLYFITSNENKLREARQIMSGIEILNEKIPLPELQGEPEDIVREKARLAHEKLKKPLFVEDTCLCFDALKGLPGPYVHDFLIKLGREGLIKLLAGHKSKAATAKCLVGYADSKGKITVFVGETKGSIANEPRGNSNFGVFGWDPIFIPAGSKKTYAEMTHEEKNSVSHRMKALKKFRNFL